MKDRYTDDEMIQVFGKIMPEENNIIFYAFIYKIVRHQTDKKTKPKQTN